MSPSMSPKMSPFSALRLALAARNPRERRLIALSALVVAFAALFSLFDWAHHERARLHAALPVAELELARMELQAQELARLRRSDASASSAQARPPARLEAARSAARNRGLALEIEVEGDALRFEGSAPPAALLDWLASLQAEFLLHAEELSIEAGEGSLRSSGRLATAPTR